MPVVSREVLIRNLVCKSSANCLQLYVFLVFLSLTSTKKRPHTLHRSSTFFACISILKYCHKNSRLILGLKKSRLFMRDIVVSVACAALAIVERVSGHTIATHTHEHYTYTIRQLSLQSSWNTCMTPSQS